MSGCCEAELDELTDRAVEALDDVLRRLGRHPDALSPHELRTYLWARSSIAVAMGIRLDSLDSLDLGELGGYEAWRSGSAAFG